MTTREAEKTGAKKFEEFPLAPILKDNLSRMRLVFTMPIQAATINPALEGRDILGTAQTGTGKTLAFVLPILEKLMHSKGGIGALVLVPTRELAMQVLDTLKNIGKGTGIPAALVVGGLSEFKQLENIRRGARIVIATPGRLEDYIKRRLVDLRDVKILVLDEADRMVDMGFLPQMRNIMNSLGKEHQTMCFSATLDKSVAHLVHAYLKNPVRAEIGSASKPSSSVNLGIYEVVQEQKFPMLFHMLSEESGTFLVFTRTKHGANKLFKKLAQKGINAGVLHGGKSQSQRIRALDEFKAGASRVLVATDIAARGIHVRGISHVINYDMPQAAEDFIHRVGRTGRVDETGIAITFVTPVEMHELHAIERSLGKKIESLPLPENLPSEPRSLHDEAQINFRFGQNLRRFKGTRRFGRRRR